MFIPPGHIKNFESNPNTGAKVRLRDAHLLIDREVALEVFRDSPNAYVVYYPDRGVLMLAPTSDEVFKSLHKASQRMLKSRNLLGDKTVALHEILIDHQIDDTNRDLEYEWQPGLGILNVKL